MKTKITRRDLLNGMAIGAGGVLFPAFGSGSGSNSEVLLRDMGPTSFADYYPPVLTGMRGSHPGSFEVAHALSWAGQKPQSYEQLNEHYDLVIVGGGMSGLAAAWYGLKSLGPEARILVLDNHDDFGGHAKRNEFHHKGRMLLSLGGAQNLDSPKNYGDIAGDLLIALGIDEEAIAQMGENTPDDYLLGGKLDGSVGLSLPVDDEYLTIGGNWLKFFHGRGDYQNAVRKLPIPEDQQDKMIAFFGGEKDFLEDLSLFEKWEYVNSVSYNQFLSERVGLSTETIPILDAHLLVLQGPSGWNHTVLEAILAGSPGLRAMGWTAQFVDSLAARLIDDVAGDIRMFPDGNASVARLLVQQLIPGVAPDMKGFEDVAVTRFDYGALDLPDQPVRIRLNSTAVGVKEVGDEVQVDFVAQGESLRVTGNRCVLACNNNLIPHLCPEMSEAQKDGLSYGVRVPFVYANVLLDDGRAYSKLGVSFTFCPYDSFQWVSSAPPITSGGYEPPRNADDPMVMFMMASPTPADGVKGTSRELLRMGRHSIYTTSFAEYEQQIREQLQCMLGKFGFDHEKDIRAITVNRIPHGYAYTYTKLDDPDWENEQAPHEVGRQQFGRISIANTDSEATPLMNAAFDAAHRAVVEQLES
ncbi:MAG: NAD(P)-binding protein [Pseudomonadales bacterium]|nr:NAD(P)-binding protein [Pseudomonadales bacterium]MBO6594621.1 NAD(P)-binding protein [Pseudomonadales bacterium]MBO6821819.1 NAD(P)-binding protein [Pseudomonadales bacterium]